MQPHILVSTDLDGTLLDHYSYSFEAALPALQQLEAQSIPVVINTSKTLSEVTLLREQLNNRHPFIVENGSGIVIPKGYFQVPPESATLDNDNYLIDFGANYSEICEFLAPLKQEFNIKGFADLSAEELQQATGLPLENVRLAKQRLFSEPLLWQGTDEDKQRLIAAVEAHNLQALQGGRFLHIMAKTDKGQSLQALKDLFFKEWQTNCLTDTGILTIALGDSGNDIAMLKSADIAVVIRSPKHEPLAVQGRQQTIITEGLGPEGWNQAMQQILQQHIPQPT